MADNPGNESGPKAWLLTWNPNNWNWNGKYDELCAKSKQGEKITKSWTCQSTQPIIGDDVFLIRLGEAPKGIVAHGIVCRESYPAPHNDPKKAEKGKTTNHIDVEFDRIQNCKTEPFLELNDLSNTFQDQKWSSQSSGIEIKGHVEELKKMWNGIVSKEAKKMTDNKEFALNTILYGPPGTGKTYNAVIYAVAICEGKTIENIKNEIAEIDEKTPGKGYDEILKRYKDYKKAGRIAFTTFHQSYGYEEFIEGIRPVMKNSNNLQESENNDTTVPSECNSEDAATGEEQREVEQQSNTGTQELHYEIKDGVFKVFCKNADLDCCKGEDNNSEQKANADFYNCSEYHGDNVADNVEITFASNKQDSESDRENSKEITEVITIDKDRPFWVLSVGNDIKYDSGLKFPNDFSYDNNIVFTDFEENSDKTAVKGMQKDDLFLLKVNGRNIVRFGQIVGERISELPEEIEIGKDDLKDNYERIIAKYYWKVKWLTSDLYNCEKTIIEIFGEIGLKPSWQESKNCKDKFDILQRFINDNIDDGTGAEPSAIGFTRYCKNEENVSGSGNSYRSYIFGKDGICKRLSINNIKDLNAEIKNDNGISLQNRINNVFRGKKKLNAKKAIEAIDKYIDYYNEVFSLNSASHTDDAQSSCPHQTNNGQEHSAKEKTKEDNGEKENLPNFVFIIDEINRGNISKIFGELITLIEDTKREGAKEAASAILPYSGEPFSVPNNVYILGTMNTADRSIALMDTALRRRFNFVEMMPDVELLKDLTIEAKDSKEQVVKIKIDEMLRAINDRIEYLYDREHTIGHAFFMKLKKEPTIEVLADIFRNKIIPLLQEYFYDDYAKIRLVLGGNFIEPKNVSLDKLFGESNLNNNKNDYNELDKTTVYKIIDNFNDSNSYLGIYLTQKQIQEQIAPNNPEAKPDDSDSQPPGMPSEEDVSVTVDAQVDGISSSTDTSSEETS